MQFSTIIYNSQYIKLNNKKIALSNLNLDVLKFSKKLNVF